MGDQITIDKGKKKPNIMKPTDWQLIPRKQFAFVVFNTPIKNYIHKFNLIEYAIEGESSGGSYVIPKQEIYINVDEEDGMISGIQSFSYCYYKLVNLIGLPLKKLIRIIGQEPDVIEEPFWYSNGEASYRIKFKDLGLNINIDYDKETVRYVSCNDL